MQAALATQAVPRIDVAQHLRRISGTLTLGVLAILATLLLPACDALQFDRAAIANGEVWRIVTGNFVHWNVDHLVWDALMFVVLGAAIELRSRRMFVGITAASALAVSATAWFLTPLATYRGLSGIDSAQFVLLAAWYLVDLLHSGNVRQAFIPVALLVGFLAKISYEIVTGHTYFVDSTAAAFVPLPQVHLAGAAVAIVVLLALRPMLSASKPNSNEGI